MMSNPANGNGHAKTTASLTLDYDLLTGSLNIKGETPSISVTIAMLGQAMREFDALDRMQRALKLQSEQKEQAENQRLAQLITKGR